MLFNLFGELLIKDNPVYLQSIDNRTKSKLDFIEHKKHLEMPFDMLGV